MVVGKRLALRAQPNAEDKPANRYIPLHDLQVKYGQLTGTPEVEVLPGIQGRRRSVSGNMLEDRQRARASTNPNAIAKVRTAQLIQGFEPYGVDVMVSETIPNRRSFAELKQEAEMHDQCLASLQELQCLETELDLTFQSVKHMTSVMQPKQASPDEGSSTGRVQGEEDVVLDLEMTKSGKEQYLVLRAPLAWELHQQGGNSNRKPRPVWGAARPKTPRNQWLRDDNNSSAAHAATGHPLGDNTHTICIDLCERIPESILLRHVKATHDNGKASAEGKISNAAVAIGSTKSKGIVSHPDGHPHALDSDFLTSHLASIASQCAMLEKNFMQKFEDHVDEQALSPEEFDTQVSDPDGSDVSANTGADTAAASTRAKMGAAVRERARGHVQDYVRDVRAALRLLGPFLPGAARVIEGAVKGLIVALDADLTVAWQQYADLEEQLAKSNVDGFEADMLRRQVRDMNQENKQLKETLASTEHRNHEEANRLRQKIEMLNEEIVKLSPDQSELDGVAGLMGDYKNLMLEMEEECVRQGDILQKMKKYTMDVIGEAVTDPSQPRPHLQGRVVELMDGEILLRPYDIADEETQVNEAELTYIDPEVPIRFRTSQARHILSMFDGKNVPSITLEEISSEIDKIYNEKIRADADSDMASMQRSDLGDFIVEYYLNSLHSVKLAQEKLCSIFRCLRLAERTSVFISPKIALFARFLGFCDFEKALPLMVLNVVLQAKKYAQASLHKQKADGGHLHGRSQMLSPQQLRGKGRESSLIQAASAESQLPVALAYEAAVKALPQSAAAYRTVFEGISQCADVDGLDQRRQIERDLLVLVLLLHDRLHREAAPKLRDLIQRAENRGMVAAEEFREAVYDAQVYYIEDSVWIKKLSDTGITSTPGQLNTDLILEYFSGGSISRFPRATITETAFMTFVTDAVAADYADRMKHLQSLWKRQTQSRNRTAVTFADFVSVVQAEEPNMPAPMLRAAFIASVEASRACTQLIDDVCLPAGNCEAVEEQYGGDVVTFKLFTYAAMKLGLFLKDQNQTQTHLHGTRHGGQERHHHAHGALADTTRIQASASSHPVGSGHAAVAAAAVSSAGHAGGAASAPKRGAAPRNATAKTRP